MEKTELEKAALEILEIAKSNLMRDGYAAKIAIVEGKDEPCVVNLSQVDDHSEAISMLRSFALEKEASTVFLVIEAWVVHRNINDGILDAQCVKPSQEDDRMEAVIVYAATSTLNIAVQTIFTRDEAENVISFTEPEVGVSEMSPLGTSFWNAGPSLH